MSLQSPEHIPFDNYTRRGTPVLWAVALVCAGVITCALFGGYILMRNRYAPMPQSSERQADTSTPPRIRAHVFADEPFLRNSQAIIGGMVRNVSDETLENLTVVLELTRSEATAGTEARRVHLTPSRLAPNEEGRYALTLPAREWRDVRVSGLRNGDSGEEIAFNTAIGARRPLESAPRPRRATQQPSRPRTGNDGFFNTPDTPVIIR